MDINGCGAHFAGARDRVTTECTQDFPGEAEAEMKLSESIDADKAPL